MPKKKPKTTPKSSKGMVLAPSHRFSLPWHKDTLPWDISRALKWLTLFSAVIGAVFLIYKWDDRYAKGEEMTVKFAEAEKSTVTTLKQFQMEMRKESEQYQKKMDLKYLYDRKNTLLDQRRQLKINLRAKPNDVDLQEQLIEVNKETDNVDKQIIELNKK